MEYKQELLLIEVERELCTNSFYEFLLSFWDTAVQEPLIDNWHIKYICDELQYLAGFIKRREHKPYDIIFNVPPGSTKTTVVLQMFPAWLWISTPFARVISSSHGHDLSEMSANKSKDIILSQRYQTLFPHVQLRKDSTAKSRYTNTKGGNRHTTSTNGHATGDHAHIKLMDDLQDISKAGSEADRNAAINHMKMLFTREVEKGNSINVLIMQRLHELDCTAYLLGLSAKRKVRHICLPAEISDLVNPPELKERYIDGLLDPKRMNLEVLEEKKIELGTYGYTSQFQQEPTPPEGGIIKRKWFGIIPKELFVAETSPYMFFVDTAYEKKKIKKAKGEPINDPTGLMACKIQKGIVIITDYREVYLELPDLCRFIQSWAVAQGYSQQSLLQIEPKASGKSTIQTLREFTTLSVMEIEDVGKKDSKETELTNASPTIQAGRFSLVQAEWNRLFLDRVCGFPFAAHDEAVDLLCYAKKYYFGSSNPAAAQEAYEKAMKLFQ